jgi:hypothetical protein
LLDQGVFGLLDRAKRRSPRAKIDSPESLTEDDKSSSCFFSKAISFAKLPLWLDELRMTCSWAARFAQGTLSHGRSCPSGKGPPRRRLKGLHDLADRDGVSPR